MFLAVGVHLRVKSDNTWLNASNGNVAKFNKNDVLIINKIETNKYGFVILTVKNKITDRTDVIHLDPKFILGNVFTIDNAYRRKSIIKNL